MQSNPFEEVCWGGLLGGRLLARGLDVRCYGETVRACWLWGCYSLLLTLGGTSDARGNMEHSKHDFVTPEVVVKSSEPISSVL